MPSNKVLILSDMHGIPSGNNYYINETISLCKKMGYESIVCSSIELADINSATLEPIHTAFVRGGIEKAANKLCDLSDTFSAVIGFSVGGTILYKALQKKPQLTDTLICVSATRLRFEKERAPCRTIAIYGDRDEHIPAQGWEKIIQCELHLIADATHDFYKTQKLQYALSIIQSILMAPRLDNSCPRLSRL